MCRNYVELVLQLNVGWTSDATTKATRRDRLNSILFGLITNSFLCCKEKEKRYEISFYIADVTRGKQTRRTERI